MVVWREGLDGGGVCGREDPYVRVCVREGPGTCTVLGAILKGAKHHMIILGLILLLIGWLASISILTTIGIILIVIGVVLWILGATGRAVGGRKYWY